MAEIHTALTQADQSLVYGMAVLCTPIILDEGHQQLAVAEVRDALPRVSRGHYYIEKIAQVADRILFVTEIKEPRERIREWRAIRSDGNAALSDFFMWRLSLLASANQSNAKEQRNARR